MPLQRLIVSCTSTFILLCLIAQTAWAGDFHFSWLPNNESTVAGYRIYYGLHSGDYFLNDYTEVDAVPDPETGRMLGTITDLDEQEAYYFAVTAFTDDYVESDFSAEIVYRTDCPITGTPLLERGEISVNNEWTDIKLQQTFAHPIVVASITSNNETEPVVVCIDEVTTDGFKIRIQGFGVPDDTRDSETVSYIVMEEGTYALTDGTLIEAGTFTTYGTNSFYPQTFKRNFNTSPVLMTAISSYNDYEAVTGRINNLDTNGFDYMMQEQEANMDGHATEVISYIAWEPSDGTVNGMTYSVDKTAEEITHDIYNITLRSQIRADFQHTPFILTKTLTYNGNDPAIVRCQNSSTTGIGIHIQEDQSYDNETQHVQESVGYIALSNNIFPPFEAGEVSLNHSWARVNFNFKYYRPVVTAKITSYIGPDASVIRITDVDQTGFSIRIQEWGCDDYHKWETASYFVMEEGTFKLPDGTLVEAGTFITSGTDILEQRQFKQAYTTPPVVVSSLSSYNETDTATGRINNITTSGFDYLLQEAEAKSDGHLTEKVSYITMEPSNGTADGIQYSAARMANPVNHVFSWNAYQTGAANEFKTSPVMILDMQTINGMDTASLRCRNNSITGLEIMVEEELTLDGEIYHALEEVGYIAVSN